jgi:uncharacterized cupin superfamily protein
MVPEARLEGGIPQAAGWFVVSARESRWTHNEMGWYTNFEGDGEAAFADLGINLNVLYPGKPMAMYHEEEGQEDFLVLQGKCLLIVEGEERPLRQWDFVHCPPGASHTIVGAGDALCVVLAVGARDRSTGPEWGAYTVDEAALRHGAGVEQETTDEKEAYARFARRKPTRYRDDWLS